MLGKTASTAVLVLAAGIGFVLAQGMPTSVKVTNGVLTDAKGMSLYTWDNDKESNKSACNGMCLMNWPSFAAAVGAADMGDWKVISRDDGGKQWAYKGKPLYYFRMDAKAGDVTGNGRGGVWHVAKQ